MAVWSFTSDCSLIAAKYQREFIYMFCLTCVLEKERKLRSIERIIFPFWLTSGRADLQLLFKIFHYYNTILDGNEFIPNNKYQKIIIIKYYHQALTIKFETLFTVILGLEQATWRNGIIRPRRYGPRGDGCRASRIQVRRSRHRHHQSAQ